MCIHLERVEIPVLSQPSGLSGGGDNCKETEDIKYSANCVFALSDILVVVLVIVAFESTIHRQTLLILPIELKLCTQKNKCV